MSHLIEKELSSAIRAVTVFSRGAQVERSVDLTLEQGDYSVLVKDLPQDADPHSIRVEGLCNEEMEIGIVDSMIEAVRHDDDTLTKPERHELEKEIESLEDSHRQVQGRIQTLEIQKNLVHNLAQLPLQPVSGQNNGGGQDWKQIYDLIGERLSNANDIIFKAQLEERDILKKIADLRQQLTQKPPKQKFICAVAMRLFVKEKVTGQLIIRYQINNASWSPVYDIRLNTGAGKEAEKQLSLERRAEIRQHSGECWDDIALKLSTNSPTSRTSAPHLSSHQLDEVCRQPQAVGSAPYQRHGTPLKKKMARSIAVMAQDEGTAAMSAPSAIVEERGAEAEQTAYQSIFSVPDQTSVGNGNDIVRVYLSSKNITPDLFVQSVPKLDLQAFLYARFKWDGKTALLAGKSWLYRDGVFVGTGILPLVNQGEKHQIGFGSDDKVKVSRREMNRITGNRGLIKNHRIDERDFIISIENMHDYAIKTHIIDQIPYADDESIVVELLQGSTPATEENVKNERGILLWKQSLKENEKVKIRLHYKVSWPKDKNIML